MTNTEGNRIAGKTSQGLEVGAQNAASFFGILLSLNIVVWGTVLVKESWPTLDKWWWLPLLILGALYILSWIIILRVFRDQTRCSLPLFRPNVGSPLKADRIEVIRNRVYANAMKGSSRLGFALGFSLFPVFMAIAYGVERPILIPITVLLCWGALIVSTKLGEDKSGGCVSTIIVVGIMGLGFSLSGVGEPEQKSMLFVWLFICIVSGIILTAALILLKSAFNVLRYGWLQSMTSLRGPYTRFEATKEFCAWLLLTPAFAPSWALASLLISAALKSAEKQETTLK